MDRPTTLHSNVCAITQKHGIAAFVVDGVIRDLVEAREHREAVRRDVAETLKDWEVAHRARIEEILRNKRFQG